jgi:hypothetical protein
MARRIKTKVMKKTLGGDDISTARITDLFEEMMGSKDADPNVIIPKLITVKTQISQIYKVFKQFSDSVLFREDFPKFQNALLQISKFADEVKENIDFNILHEEEYYKMDKTDINLLYRTLKNNNYVQKLIVVCGNLKKYSANFSDTKNLKDNFIMQEPGLSFRIFDFSTLDLKLLWIDSNITPTVKRYVLCVLSKLYENLFELYKTITSPDVDIDEFSEILMKCLEKLKKQPGLNRCNNAFKRISESIGLLKNNFTGYYRESVASANPNIIIESFIIDVSNQSSNDARLTREFRIIIAHLHKMSNQSGKIKDPKIKGLFNMLNNNFAAFDKGMGKTSEDESSSSMPSETPADDETNISDVLDNVDNLDNLDNVDNTEEVDSTEDVEQLDTDNLDNLDNTEEVDNSDKAEYDII